MQKLFHGLWEDICFFKHLLVSYFEALSETNQMKQAFIRDIVVVLVTCKNEEDPLKNKDARVATTQNIDVSNTQGQITAQSEFGSGRNSNSSEML